MATRIEKDTMGEVEIPQQALYGPQTQRAINNFSISKDIMPEEFIRSIIQIKRSAALANQRLHVLEQPKVEAIVKACDHLTKQKDLLIHFPVSVYQTGSGTSTNMNANEVIARLGERMTGVPIHPNDHVNACQSSNDVIPTAIHVSAALYLETQLLPTVSHCIKVIDEKADSLNGIIKTGRTHLMDAMPIPFPKAVRSWGGQLETVKRALTQIQPSLQEVAQGGTAVGTGVNAHPKFQIEFCKELSDCIGLRISSPKNDVFHLMAGQETSVLLAGHLKALAVALIKIANDLRWMNSGPLAGLGEIQLVALQPGSSIMPGKVNPVIPEAVIMACYQVVGYEAAITMCGQSGQFELNVSLPLIASNLIHSMSLLTRSTRALADQVIRSFEVNTQKIEHTLSQNPMLVTALNTRIGYDKAALIAKRAYVEKRPLIDVAAEETNIDRDELQKILEPAKLAQNSCAF